MNSCNRNPENVTVIYDTIPANTDTDFNIIQETTQSFVGVLPCADCGGILTELEINTDSISYILKETYQAKKDGDSVLTSKGQYIRNLSQGDASIIYQLNSTSPDQVKYFKALGDSAVVMLDKQQKEIVSKLNYRLVKK